MKPTPNHQKCQSNVLWCGKMNMDVCHHNIVAFFSIIARHWLFLLVNLRKPAKMKNESNLSVE